VQPSDAGQRRQQWCDTVAGGDLKKSREIENLLRDLQDKVKSFNLPILCLEIGTKPATALDVFVKLNTSGVPLSIFEIIVAQFEGRTGKSMHVSAKEPLKYLTERIDRADLGEPVVRYRLMSHVVPFEELHVGGMLT
jgi:hypothetical protein